MAYGLRSAVVVLLLMNFHCLTAFGQGCCFSRSPPGLNYAIQESDFYFKAERISTSVTVSDKAELFVTTFEVTQVFKASGSRFKVGHRFEFRDGHNSLDPAASEQEKMSVPKRGTAVLFVSGSEDIADTGGILCETNDAVSAYLASTAAAIANLNEKDDRRKLFVPYLCHSDSVIAEDAITEISAVGLDDGLPSLVEDLPRKKVLDCFSNPKTPAQWLGHYGLLIGMIGNPEDGDVLEKKIVELDSDFRLGLEGVIAGYLLIRGEEGLDLIEETKMRARTCKKTDGTEVPLPFSETYAAMVALRFLDTYEPQQIPHERLCESMRLLLDRPEMADLVITDLARMKDWESQDRVIAMFDEKRFEIPAIRRAIVRYLYYSAHPKDEEDKESTEFAEHSIRAEKALEEIRRKDPKLYDDAKRYLIRKPPSTPAPE